MLSFEKHQAAGLEKGDMTVKQMVVCLISTRRMLEVLPIMIDPIIVVIQFNLWVPRGFWVLGVVAQLLR